MLCSALLQHRRHASRMQDACPATSVLSTPRSFSCRRQHHKGQSEGSAHPPNGEALASIERSRDGMDDARSRRARSRGASIASRTCITRCRNCLSVPKTARYGPSSTGQGQACKRGTPTSSTSVFFFGIVSYVGIPMLLTATPFLSSTQAFARHPARPIHNDGHINRTIYKPAGRDGFFFVFHDP